MSVLKKRSFSKEAEVLENSNSEEIDFMDTRESKAQTVESISFESQRSGKWTADEEAFANQLIEDFESGALQDCDDGCTLRSYLARKLRCAPMRISKKYAGRCIGKRVFKKINESWLENERNSAFIYPKSNIIDNCYLTNETKFGYTLTDGTTIESCSVEDSYGSESENISNESTSEDEREADRDIFEGEKIIIQSYESILEQNSELGFRFSTVHPWSSKHQPANGNTVTASFFTFKHEDFADQSEAEGDFLDPGFAGLDGSSGAAFEETAAYTVPSDETEEWLDVLSRFYCDDDSPNCLSTVGVHSMLLSDFQQQHPMKKMKKNFSTSSFIF